MGKWKPDFDPRADGANQVIDADTGMTVCFVATGTDVDEQDRVTYVLAAAPELLEACIHVCDWITDQFEDPLELDVVKELRAAIHKARGLS